MDKRYSFYGINGLYYIYDNKYHHLIPSSPTFKTKKACLVVVNKMNQEQVGDSK